MILVIETGQGLADANSYIDIADVEKYLPSSTMTKFNELSLEERIDRIIIASLFIDTSFNWIGRQKTLEQGLCWPRVNAWYQGYKIPDDFIPTQIKKAVIMALELLMEFGLGVFQQSGDAQIKKEKLGPMETEYFEALKVEYINSSSYSAINNILRCFYFRPGSVMAAEVERK